MDAMTLVNLNLGFQLVLAAAIGYAAFLATRKQLDRHCRVMRFAIAGQILSIAVVMLPNLIRLVDALPVNTGNGLLMWGHHSLGLLVVGLWIYINLVMTGKITAKGRLIGIMRLALVSWLASLILGIYIFSLLWPWPWA